MLAGEDRTYRWSSCRLGTANQTIALSQVPPGRARPGIGRVSPSQLVTAGLDSGGGEGTRERVSERGDIVYEKSRA